VTTVSDLKFNVSAPSSGSVPTINLAGMAASAVSVEIMLDDLLAQKKPDILRIKIAKSGAAPGKLFIDTVNGKSIDHVPMKIANATESDGKAQFVGEAPLKALAKHFQKGINRFDIAFEEDGVRKGTEVIVDVQM